MKIAIKLIGLFLGIFIRTWVPFIRKVKQGKIEKFEKKYLSQAVSSALFAVVAVLLPSLIPFAHDSVASCRSFHSLSPFRSVRSLICPDTGRHSSR